jgi:hypothetical protein
MFETNSEITALVSKSIGVNTGVPAFMLPPDVVVVPTAPLPVIFTVLTPAAYFWLQSFYDGNLIAINPIIDIYKEYPYNLYNDDKELKLTRQFQTENTICIISDELRKLTEVYDNEFYDTTVIVADESIKDIKEFWSIGSTFDQVFNYMVKYK